MKTALIAVAILSLSGAAAFAQNAPMPTGPANGAPGTSYSGTGSSTLPPSTAGTPQPGALDSGNATAELAATRAKIESAGFSNVQGLSRSPDGTWRGRGTKNGVEVAVSLDTAGHIMTQ